MLLPYIDHIFLYSNSDKMLGFYDYGNSIKIDEISIFRDTIQAFNNFIIDNKNIGSYFKDGGNYIFIDFFSMHYDLCRFIIKYIYSKIDENPYINRRINSMGYINIKKDFLTLINDFFVSTLYKRIGIYLDYILFLFLSFQKLYTKSSNINPIIYDHKIKQSFILFLYDFGFIN